MTDNPMNGILTTAEEYREQVAMRATAHYKSAEWHRHQSAKLGGIATVLSALVGTTIFATITSQLGLDGQGHISLPSGGWALLGYAVFVLILIASPVLTGLQTFLNNAEQAEQHRGSWAGYLRLQQRLDIFLLRYAEVNPEAAMREKALQELKEITTEIGTMSDNSITLTKRAYDEARTEATSKILEIKIDENKAKVEETQ